MISLLYLVGKAEQYFVTLGSMFLDEKTVLEVWLNPRLNLTNFWRTGPWSFINCEGGGGGGAAILLNGGDLR